MGFQDVALLPYRASFYIKFLNNGDKGESLGTTICPKSVAWGKQGHIY